MSTLKRGDLEQYSPIDLDPLVGLHRPSTSHEESGQNKKGWENDLCHAISCNKWSDVKAILDQHPTALTAVITDYGRTTLHEAAMFGNVTIVEELLKLLPPEYLLTFDAAGDTALALACWYNGNTQVAKCLVNKNSHALVIPNMNDDLPVTVAFENGYQEMGRYLYSVTPLESITGRRGSSLLCSCFKAQCFDIALNLLYHREELLLAPINKNGSTPFHDIATLNTTILSLSELIFWKRWIYNFISVPSTKAVKHVCVDMQNEDRCHGDKEKLIEPGVIHINLGVVKKIRDLKLLHAQANELLDLACKNARKAHQIGAITNSLCLAAKEGNVEFVSQVSKAIPEISLNESLKYCFIEALTYRQAEVFNLIHGFRFKNGLITSKTNDGNSLMHRAAKKAPDHVLNRIYAPTLQMQRELQWFEEVESLTPPGSRELQNNDGMTAKEVFRESHRELIKEGEKWLKATASSCSVVGTLIMTIMFAAAFTVPGGNDQNLGCPLYIKQAFFKVFIFTTIVSLLSSSASVLMFLAILTSHYSEENFLKSLPTKLILGLSFLFISIVSMIIAFLSTIRLMLEHTNYSWAVLPITLLASLPIFLFGLSQFPLLIHTYVSTYGNIFDRKVKPWP